MGTARLVARRETSIYSFARYLILYAASRIDKCEIFQRRDCGYILCARIINEMKKQGKIEEDWKEGESHLTLKNILF